MAKETAETAGLGLDLDIRGLPAIKELAELANRIKAEFHEINEMTGNVTSSIKGLSATAHKVGNFNLGAGVGENIKAVQKLSNEMKRLPSERVDKIGGKFGDAAKQTEKATKQTHKLGDAFRSVGEKARKSGHRIRDIVAGSFIANGVINSWYNLKTGISEAIKAGEEYDKEQQVMHATWNTLTGDAKKGNKMVKAINDISVKFGQSSDLVNELNQQFYHVLDKQGPTDKLTKSVLTLADTLGMGAENVQRLGLNFTHMMSSGKMQLGDFNMITDQLPMFGERLLEYERKAMKNSKLSMAQLRADMSAGKVSAKDAEAVMNGLGKKYAKASENMMKTMSGMERVISARGKALSGALIKPIINAKNPLFGAVSKWVSDPHTETEFKKVGQSVSKGLGTITEAFSKAVNPKKAPHFADDVMKNIASGITSVSKSIAKHANSIVNFFSALSSSMKIIMTIGSGFAKGLVSGLNAILSPVNKLTGKTKGVNSFAGTLKNLTKQKSALETFGRVLAAAFAISKIAKFVGGAKRIKDAFISIKDGAMIAGQGLKTAFTFMKANPFIAIISAVVAVGAALVELYKHNKKFRKFVNGLIAGAKKAFSGVTKWFKNLGKGVAKTFSSIKEGVTHRFGGSMKAIGKLTHDGVKVAQSYIKLFTDFFTGKWGNLGKDIKKLTSNLWKSVKQFFKSGFNFIDDLTGGHLSKMIGAFQDAWSNIGKGWHSFWNGIDSWFGKLWGNIKKTVSGGINGVIGVLNAGIGGINSVLHAFGGKKTTIGKIGTVHLATGTGAMGNGYRRKITKPTLATLNDGNDSPETGNQEAIIHPNGVGELVKGRNTIHMLEPGAEVLNATELKIVREMAHFKKGTGLLDGIKSVASNVVGGVVSGVKGLGDFASKAWHGATNLAKIMTKIVSGPTKYLNSLMSKPTGDSPVMKGFADGFFDSMHDKATSWWSEVWNQLGAAANSAGGGSAAGGNWRHNPGLAKTNGFGASRSFGSHDGNDFSGSLGSAILAMHGGKVIQTGAPGHGWPESQLGKVIVIKSDDGYQQIYQEFGGMKNIKTHVGDIVKTGQKIATLGPLNGAGSGAHVHVGLSKGSVWDHGGSSTRGWLDITKMHGTDNGSSKLKPDKNSGNNSGLAKLVKSELGGGIFKWITDHIAPLLSSGGNGDDSIEGGAITHGMISKALQLAKIPKKFWSKMQHDIIAVAKSETGNQNEMQKIHDVNSAAGNPAGGPLQFTKSTFEAFAFPGHHNWRSSFDQVLAFLNNSQYASAAGQTTIWGHSKFDWLHSGPQGHKRFRKSGGKVKRGESYIVGEEGWEEFTPETDGTIKSHKESVNAQTRASARTTQRAIQIDAHMDVKIGSIDSGNKEQIMAKFEKMMEAHAKKIRETLGANDEGGIMA
ncbi:tape measure protein [Secundilactobacillus kimchicus]|uniref:tape measure protein n=1 Tax=Secundilactobacillus kimchicus TaxID=528209 RepID=UPI0024A9A749|nr:tape measure protein [Secundilactobacillus kimchicus]